VGGYAEGLGWLVLGIEIEMGRVYHDGWFVMKVVDVVEAFQLRAG
jgi:hypothetical protein